MYHDKSKEELIKEIEELKISEEKFRFISENSPDALFSTDEKGIITYISPSVKNTFGYSVDEMENHFFVEFLTEDEIPRVMAVFKESIHTGLAVKEFCFSAKHKNGNNIVVELASSAIVKDEKSAKVTGIIRDVTERVRSQKFEKKHTAFLQNIIDSIAHPFYAIDADNYTIILANRHTDSYIQGKTTCYQLTHKRETPCNCTEHPCTIELVKSTGKSVIIEHIHYDRDDNMRNVEVHAHPVFNENGHIHQIIEYSIDITERKKAEDSLLRLKKAICDSSDAFFLTDIEGIITFMNPGFTALYGYTPEEVIGKATPRILKSGNLNQSVYEGFWNTLLKKEEVKGELLNKRKNGSLVEIEATSNAILDINNSIIGFLSIQRDITERKRDEMIIQRQNQELHELNATKDKFFSIIAHDLRSPFSSIIGLSDLLMKNIDKYDNQKIKSFTNLINDAAHETFKLLENLLEWSRLQRGKIQPKCLKQDFKTIVSEICLLYTNIAATKNIKIENNIKELTLINCDKEMTKTVLRNLISNAIKFTESGGIVSISAILHGQTIEAQITDTGVGIPKSYLPYVFSIDKNISTSGTAGENGTGLGLLISKELIEKQGGRIRVESEEGKGTTFNFTLNCN